MIGLAFPKVRPYVQGVQFLFATKDVWDSFVDEKKDSTSRALRTVEAAQSGAGLILSLTGASPLATNLNEMGGMLVSTADAVYTLQVKGKID
jgi:hypothetical protein